MDVMLAFVSLVNNNFIGTGLVDNGLENLAQIIFVPFAKLSNIYFFNKTLNNNASDMKPRRG